MPLVRRVLVVAFFYPPVDVVGAIRAGHFVKHLPAHGWLPTVLTIDRFVTQPATLVVPGADADVVRAPYVDPIGWGIRALRGPTRPASGSSQASSRPAGRGSTLVARGRKLLGINVVRMPDRALPWLPAALLAGGRLCRQTGFDAIWSTAPPPTTHLVARHLSRRFGLPWVADYRDPWSGNHFFRRSGAAQAAEERLERWALAPARELVTVSGPIGEGLSRLHGKSVTIVTNGYDDVRAVGEVAPPSRLTLSYTGSIYPGRRDPGLLFEAIRQLVDAGALMPGELTVQFCGTDPVELGRWVERYRVDAFVEQLGTVAHDEARRQQERSSALLLLDWGDPSEQGVYSLKLFEYIGARRPILAVGVHGNGIVRELIERCGAGVYCATVDEAARQLGAWVAEYRREGHIAYRGRPEEVGRYHYRELTGQVAQILTRVCDPAGGRHG